jgi:adenine-specific DNA-methyltransferase
MTQPTLPFDLAAPTIDVPPYSDFPSTRYQGSKRKILPFLFESLRSISPGQALDLYSGTASVSLLLRTMGWQVHANDYLPYNKNTAHIFLTLENPKLDSMNIDQMIAKSLRLNGSAGRLVTSNYEGVFFRTDENTTIDNFCANLGIFPPEHAQILIYLMGQAMLMKRPYNLFHRANLSMRLSTVERSFGNAKTWERSFGELMRKLGRKLKCAPFYGPIGSASCVNTLDLDKIDFEPDLVYLDPPYLNAKSHPVDYSDFYGFLNGLLDYEAFLSGDTSYPHRPIGKVQTAWATPSGGLEEIARVARRWPNAAIAISYRGDGLPTPENIIGTMSKLGLAVQTHSVMSYKYALSKSFDTTERLFIGIRT